MSDSTDIVAGTWASGIDRRSLRSPREAALWVIERSLANGESADRLRALLEGSLAPRDRALLHQLVAGVLRWLLRLDDVLVAVGGRPIRKIDPRLLGPLRLGAFQLLYLDRVPVHAAVDTSVELAKKRRRAGASFVNALLRKVATAGHPDNLPVLETDPVRRLSIESSHPPFLVKRWWQAYGEERVRAIVETNNRDRPSAVLAVRGEAGRAALVRELADEGVVARESPLSPVGLLAAGGKPLAGRAFARGELYPQDEASQCAALVPLPEPGERILDALAAPGGKTLSLLAWEPRLEVVAADRSVDRLQLLLANRQRTDRRYSVLASDAARPGLGTTFDRVVADLPCTGTGTLRKHPELRWRIRPREIERLTREASRILAGLAPLVAAGGLLVVSTCSIEPEENEDQVAAFVDRHPGFELADLAERIHPAMTVGIEARGRWRLFPEDDHDGFTVHALRRRRA